MKFGYDVSVNVREENGIYAVRRSYTLILLLWTLKTLVKTFVFNSSNKTNFIDAYFTHHITRGHGTCK